MGRALVMFLLASVTGSVYQPSDAQPYPNTQCAFNSMCSCKLTRLASTATWSTGTVAPNTAVNISSTYRNQYVPSNPYAHFERSSEEENDFEQYDESDAPVDDDVVQDISCVGVPLGSFPALPQGKISHVDIINSGLEVVDLGILSGKGIISGPKRIRVESLRLMSNRIRSVSEQIFSSMADDLTSLDLSYNELDEIPIRALRALKVLDWANFHSNRLASLDGLGQLWSHFSTTLHALFLGNNDLTELQRSSVVGRRWDTAYGHHSLSLLRELNWLNLDGNYLTDIRPESLPLRLHTLSAAQNRITNFPINCLQELQELRWLDLRGNFIQHLPIESVRHEGAVRLKLDKLDLGENLIANLPEVGSIFNRSLQIRDIYLDFNRITRLPDSVFRGTNAARLYLAGNGMIHLDEKAFHSLSLSLILLDLDRNKLQEYPTALDHLKRLRFLYLANNQLSRLAQSDFASFGAHLEALSLAGNHLRDFPALALHNCPKLVHLNLAYNVIENVTGDMFQGWAESLEVLVLKGNQIRQLPSRMFRHTSKLRELSLSFNRLIAASDEAFVDLAESLESLEMNMVWDSAPFPKGLLRPVSQLQWLSLEHNRLLDMPTSSLDHLHQLQFLSLEGNRLTNIPANLFKSNKLGQLRDVRLAHNLIESLGPKTFHDLHEVTTIILSNNKIHTIHSTAFDHLPKLITLNLSQNRLEHLEEHAFKFLPSLLQIELQSNRLREFSWKSLVNCTANPFMAASLNLSDNLIRTLGSDGREAVVHIKTLDISHNMLAAFPDQEFLKGIAPRSLKKLLVHHNRITSLTKRVLNPCLDLQVLEMHHNLIAQIDRDTFFGAKDLQIVDVSRNKLEQLAPALFIKLKRLRIVNLSHNHLRMLPKDIFDGTAVDTLNLAHNHLTSLPVSSLSNISATLVHLDLSSNHIDHLDAVLLSKLTNLVSLNLAHNRLSLLPDNVFSHLNSLLSLDLSFNVITANFKELFHELQRVKDLQLASIGLNRWPHLPLPNLITLNLSSNGLDYRSTDQSVNTILIRLDRLRSLDLSRNRFSQIPNFLWGSAPLLKQLDLSSNPIRTINRDSFAGLTRLQSLSLQPLPVLETIESDSFHQLFYLTHLKMQTWPGPHISQLVSGLTGLRKLCIEVRGPVLSSHFNFVGALQAAPKLKDLEIVGSQLKTIQPDVFANIGIHTSPECSVSIKHTSVKHLPERFIVGLEGCASLTLDLRANALQTLGIQSIRNNNSLSITSTRHLAGGLWLDQNPWTCSCSNSWLGEWLKRWYLETTAIRHPATQLALSTTTCRDPTSLKRKNLVDLAIGDNSCIMSAVSQGTVVNTPHSSTDILAIAVILLFQRHVSR